MDDEAAAANTQGGYTRAIHIGARIEAVFERLATLDGIKAWWEGSVVGKASAEGGLRFTLPDSDDYTQMRVDSVVAPTDVAWSVVEDSGYGGEWTGTSIVFHLDEDVDGSCILTLHHRGLTPALDCFMDCRTGWDRHLDRIRESAETATE
jgi:uncharacterized protein YndB with AHSA1/START domain